jgi:hypothetical protein
LVLYAKNLKPRTMKTFVISFVISLLIVSNVSAQNHSFDKFFNRYADKDGFLTVKFSNPQPGMFNSGDKESDLRISSLRVLTVQDDELNSRLNFYNEIEPQLNRVGYEELMTIKKKGQKSIFLCKRDKKHVTEVLFVAGGRNNVLVEITGSMSLAQARKIAEDAANNSEANNDVSDEE